MPFYVNPELANAVRGYSPAFTPNKPHTVNPLPSNAMRWLVVASDFDWDFVVFVKIDSLHVVGCEDALRPQVG